MAFSEESDTESPDVKPGMSSKSTGDTTTASKSGEILMVFHELMSMAKHMLEEVLPDVLLLLDNSTVETIIQLCEDFDGSLLVFKKICKIVAKKNLSLQVRPQSDNISVHRDEKQHDDSVVEWTAPVPTTGPQEEDDDHVWKTLLKDAELSLDGSKKHQIFFYCGLCNVRSNDEKGRDAHEGGKKHKDRLPKVDCIKTKCDTCAFQLISDHQHVSLILASPEHISLDAIFHDRQANKTNTSVQENRHEVMPEEKSDVRNTSSRDVQFHGNKIVSHFVELTATMKNLIETRVDFTICCCMACNYLAENRDQWILHLKSPVHKARTSSKNVKNKMCACLQCDFGLIAFDAVAPSYMCYHIERCHNQCTDNIIFEDYMVINNLPNPNVQGKHNSSNPSSFKGSADSLHLSRRSSFDDGPLSRPSSRTDRTHKGRNGPSKYVSPVRMDSGRSSPFSGRSTPSISSTKPDLLHENGRKSQADSPSPGPGRSQTVGNKGSHERTSSSPYDSVEDSRTGSAAGGNFNKPNPSQAPPSDELTTTKSPSPPQENHNSSVSDDISVSVESAFVALLQRKEMIYRENASSRPFAGFCLLCPHRRFIDAFKWCDHQLTHPPDHMINEVECSTCNTHFFGHVPQIQQLMILHPMHIRIDQLMRS